MISRRVFCSSFARARSLTLLQYHSTASLYPRRISDGVSFIPTTKVSANGKLHSVPPPRQHGEQLHQTETQATQDQPRTLYLEVESKQRIGGRTYRKPDRPPVLGAKQDFFQESEQASFLYASCPRIHSSSDVVRICHISVDVHRISHASH